MKKTGAQLAVFALEQLGIRHTFGIPGVHNTELYDELNKSPSITPILVTHEGCGAFMADAVSRTSGSVGCLVIVPAAGTTHALSGIAEAYLDGIPLLVISGGVRRDSGRSYQLHDICQETLVKGCTKAYHRVDSHRSLIPTFYEAYRKATSGEPGPVFIEIPVHIQLFEGEVDSLPPWTPPRPCHTARKDLLEEVAELLLKAQKPGIFVGWGARHAVGATCKIAETLEAPVATTLQGLSAFPADHPLHTGMGFGPAAVPAATEAFLGIDVLLAIGTRFSEIPTGSFGISVPENLIHIDINPEVFHRNYPARLALEGDAQVILPQLAEVLESKSQEKRKGKAGLRQRIAQLKQQYKNEWDAHLVPGRVNPSLFLQELRQSLSPDDFLVVDDGNHTFLAAELFPVLKPGRFISPTDFNCMGYAVPASIGVKLANPKARVAALVGDGAFLMTGLELLTASSQNCGVVVCVFNDGELAQISQGQQIPYNRKTCTILGKIDIKGVADATGAKFFRLENHTDIATTLKQAFEAAEAGQPVLIDIKVDYSKPTRFTGGIVKTNLGRFPMGEKVRFIGRALKRKVTG